MARRKLVIDCDPGIDDSFALLLAFSPASNVDVVGITTVAGNHPSAEHLARNACYICELVQHEHVPVHVGSSDPISRPFAGQSGQEFHGTHGFGYHHFVPKQKTPDTSISGAEFIVAQARLFPGEITLLALGPLTNVALALKLEPKLPSLLKDLVIMGGAFATHGNATPVAEANFKNDPEAVETVLKAENWNCLPRLVGLDVTRKAVIKEEQLASLSNNSPESSPLSFLLKVEKYYFDNLRGLGELIEGGIPLHDPSAMMSALAPELFEYEKERVVIETKGDYTYGMSIVDWRGRGGTTKARTKSVTPTSNSTSTSPSPSKSSERASQDLPANASIALSVHSEALLSSVIRLLEAYL